MGEGDREAAAAALRSGEGCWEGHECCYMSLDGLLASDWLAERTAANQAACGGCEGLGSHRRWCREVVGYVAGRLGPLSEGIEEAGDLVGANNAGLANLLYAAAGELRAFAREQADQLSR